MKRSIALLPRRQSGVVLLVTLIALVIVLVGALALMRSSDTTSVIAGNIGFERDLNNNAERAIAISIAAFGTSGALNNPVTAYTSLPSANYSATTLQSSAGNQGIPDVLLNDSATGTNNFASVGVSSNDIVDTASGITIRYVIDRMCSQTGAVSPTTCVLNTQNSDKGGTSWLRKAGGGFQPVYRVSIRVTGPRSTQAFVQTTLAN